jgi:hypothetical protein
MYCRKLVSALVLAGVAMWGSTTLASPRDHVDTRERVTHVRERVVRDQPRDRMVREPVTRPTRVSVDRVPKLQLVKPGPLCARPGGPCER